MKGDFSKKTFVPEKHFHGVLMQQGRVLLDAEWNEQASITAYRTETGNMDIIGKSGTPFDAANPNGGFQLIPVDLNGNPCAPLPGVNFKISKGHFYVDGILCENESDVLFTAQPDYIASLPIAPASPPTPITFKAYLDVWQRHITPLEDKEIKEVALGGADTTTRAKTVWQVKLQSVAPGTTCDTSNDIAVTGKLRARTEKTEQSINPCRLSASGGYRRLENQLYRVEIHRPGNKNTATFKYSIDNGSVLVKWEGQDTNDKHILTVSSIGRDELLGFGPGDWIELIGDNTELFGNPGVLAKVLSAVDNVITIDSNATNVIFPPVPADGPTINSLDIAAFGKNTKIRRWDSEDPNTQKGEIKVTSGWLKLGKDGIEVEFDGTNFRSGDYWLIPARTATADIEWSEAPDPSDPSATIPLFQYPKGIKHHVAELALLKLESIGSGSYWSVINDCRKLFPHTTQLTSLFYVSGDGQEAMPGAALPNPIVVGVANGKWPVKNARVKFSLVAAGVGSINVPADGIVFTDSLGLASCNWTLGGTGTPASQQVKAELLEPGGNPTHLPVIFTANLSSAEQVAYNGGDCNNWGGQNPRTVADALTALCKRTSGKRGCSFTIGKGGDFDTLFEALNQLAQKGTAEICLCFLPNQVHKIERDIEIASEETKTIKISGCNVQIEMDEVKVSLITGKIILQGLNLLSKTIKKAQIFLRANETDITNCEFARLSQDPSIVPFILIGPTLNAKTEGIFRCDKTKITSRIDLHGDF
ncbi:MAG TPA: DUF6519 domain-containing protein, partial [Chitinophagaceae bacterium]|nr:DUF6519 domain-containing protein [Chitinophagaceae bacterium]